MVCLCFVSGIFAQLQGAPAKDASPAAEPQSGDVPQEAATAPIPAGTGTIQGVVRFSADPAQPWALSRYYVKSTRDPKLAEAVVAIDPAPDTPRPESPRAKVIEVDQLNFQFVPESAAIRVGDSVRFKNSDSALHNVLSTDSRARFNVNMFQGGDYVRKFTQASGVTRPIPLSCVYHGSMRGWVFVFDHPWFAISDRNGAFKLEHVPAGQHVLKIRHAAGNLEALLPITVLPDKTVHIEASASIKKPASTP